MAQRVFPKIIRKISIKDNTEEITIEKTYDEYNHFYLVPKKVNSVIEEESIENNQFERFSIDYLNDYQIADENQRLIQRKN